MITTAILLVLGGLLGLVLWQLFRGRTVSKPAPVIPMPAPAASSALELMQARPGDVISVPGAAEDFSDLDFTVDRRSAYDSRNRRWTDLSGDFRGRRVYIEVQPGGTEAMGIFDPRRLTPPDVGTTEEELADMDARQDPSAFLTFEGKQWHFESSREIGYYENETGEGEGLYRWIFRESGGNRLICIEKWEGEPFDVRIGQHLNPRDITVFRAA